MSRARLALVVCGWLLGAVVIVVEQASARNGDIGRSRITGSTLADPFVARGSYTLSLRGRDLVARWRGRVRRTTRLDFAIIPSTKSGHGLPGFHGEPPEQHLLKIARRGRHRTVTVVFKHPKVVRGWPCVTGNVIDEPTGQPRVWPLGPMTVRLLCPRGGFVK